MSRIRTVLVAVALVLAGAAPALASTASIDDPQDGLPTVSGVPTNPDVSRVEFDYGGGTLQLAVRFHHALKAVDTSQNFAFFGNFALGFVKAGYKSYTCDTAQAGAISGQHHVLSSRITYYDQATVSGYDGTFKLQRTMGSDDRSMVLTGSSPVIANRDYSCATYTLRQRRYGPASNINTTYDPGCDCWYFPGVADEVGEHPTPDQTTTFVIYFDGRRPAPLPSCGNGADDDGDGVSDWPSDRGCTDANDGDERNEACSNGIDDDADGKKDYPSDDGCSSAADTTEHDPLAPACSNSRDDDGDGKVDHPADKGCTSGMDATEQLTNCEDGRDSDGDGRKDLQDLDHDGESGSPECDGIPVIDAAFAKGRLKAEASRRFNSFRRASRRTVTGCQLVGDPQVKCTLKWTYRSKRYRMAGTVLVRDNGKRRYEFGRAQVVR